MPKLKFPPSTQPAVKVEGPLKNLLKKEEKAVLGEKVMEKSSVEKAPRKTEAKKKTKLIVKIDVGFGNSLFIRGEGAGLSWEKGIMLQNASIDEWVWEFDKPFKNCEFKVLLNDQTYEVGPNHKLPCESTLQYTPHF